MRCFLLLIVLFLAGCGGGGNSEPTDNSNHGYGWSFDVEGQSGLRLRKSNARSTDATSLELFASAISTCANISTQPPPFVIYVPEGSLAPKLGRYLPNPPLILLDEKWADVVFPHEVVHYLLDMSTGQLDASHVSPLFAACAPQV